MTIEEVSASKQFISKEKRLSLTPKEGSTNKKKKWYVEFICEKCEETVVNVYQKNTWNFMCGKCSRGRKTTEEFVSEAKAVHGDRYCYDKTNYVNNGTKVTITCLIHGDFYQRPTDHVGGKTSCPVCSARERSQIVPSHLVDSKCTMYWGYFPSINMWKIGVTCQNLEDRFGYTGETMEVIWAQEMVYSGAVVLEKRIKMSTRDIRYSGNEKLLKNGGDYELFYKNVLPTYETVKDILDGT